MKKSYGSSTLKKGFAFGAAQGPMTAPTPHSRPGARLPQAAWRSKRRKPPIVPGRSAPLEELEPRNVPAASLDPGGSLVADDPRHFLNPYVQIGDFSVTNEISIAQTAYQTGMPSSSASAQSPLPSTQSVADLDRWRDELFAWHSIGAAPGAANVVLVDMNLADSLSLAYAAGAGTQVFGYDSRAQSANQVLSALVTWASETGTRIESLAIFSHGSAGQFALGDDWISSSSLACTSAEWVQLANVLADSASIEIYSCDVAAIPAGDALLDQLATLTGAQVYASTNLTGAGGDWTLEASSDAGSTLVGLPSFLNSQRLDAYQFTLASPTANNDTYNVSEDSTLTVSPPSANLANWFRFDEGAGQTISDSGSLGNTGTLGSTTGADASDPTWSSGFIGSGSLTFDGVDDYVQTDSTIAQTSNNFTLSAWFQTNTTTSQHHILWEGFAGGDGNGNPTPGDFTSSEMNLSIGTYNSANKIVFFLGYDLPENGADAIHIISTDDFTDTTSWHHVAVTVTDLGGGVFSASLYVDGKLEGSDTGSQIDRSQWGAMRIGRPGAATRFFDGQIDEVRVYDTDLTAGQVKQIAQAGVLKNDTDPQSLPLQVNTALVTGPSNGTLTINPDGTFSYTPNSDFYGVDTFTYVATDGTESSAPATVTINVLPVNDAPSISAPAAESTTKNTSIVFSTANGNAISISDIDAANGQILITLSATNGKLTLGSTAGLTFNSGDGVADGSMQFSGTLANVNAALQGLIFAPNNGFHGSAGIGIVVNDQGNTGGGNLTDSVGISINVANTNAAAVAGNDSYSTNQNTTLSVAAPGILGNDNDPDGDPLTPVLVTGPSHGSLTLNSDGSFSYTPDAGYFGSDSFTYRASDGSFSSNLATVSLTVNFVNTPPVAVNDSFATNEDTPLVVASSGILGNDTDIDGQPLTAILVSGPSNGSLTLNANGSFTYTPNANFNGVDSFVYRANDGITNSNAATVQISVNAVSDAPAAANDSYSLAEDGALTVPAIGVLGNDSDVDGDPLSAALVSGPSHGTLTFNSDGSFSYTPDADYHGSDSFTYRAFDGSANSNLATVALTITSVNDAPVAANDVYATNEDTALTIGAPGLLSNDSDVDGDPLTAVLVSGPANGTLALNSNGSFTYTPNANFHGADSFTYRARDGTTNSNLATVQITVNSVNDAPIAANDSYSLAEDGSLSVPAAGVLANDSDADGDALSASLVSGPSHGTLTFNPDGSFVYTPSANYNGSDSFTYVANDGTINSNTATVFLSISSVNDAPVASNDSYATNEDTPLTVPANGVLANDVDVDGDPLTALLVTGPLHGTLSLNADGSFVYTPNANYNGTDSFSYRANDGSVDSNVATVLISIASVNDAPVAADDSYSMSEDGILVVGPTGLLANDFDVDANPLTAIVAAGPSHGTLTLNADGSFTYTPNANYNGADSFTYVASDGSATSNVATVSIVIAAVNDAPVAVDDIYTINEDATLSISAPGLLANDSDVDGDPLTVTLAVGPAHGTLVLQSDGSFIYTPAANFNGVDTFQYRATDGALQSFSATVTIYVDPVNDAPTAGDVQAATNAGTTLHFSAANLLANAYDVDGDPLSIVIEQAPAHGSLIFSPDGSFQYRPDPGYAGFDSFLFRVSDGSLLSKAASVVIEVKADGLTAVPPPPVSSGYIPSALPPSSAPANGGDGSSPLNYAQQTVRDSGGGVGGGEAPGGTAAAAAEKPASATSETSSESTGDMLAGTPSARNAAVDPTTADPVRRLGFSASSGFEGTRTGPAIALVPTLISGSPVPGVFLVPEPLRKELNRVSEEMKNVAAQRQAEVWVVSGVAWSATAGYLIWNLRTFAVFATAALTARPLWKQFDPLSVLDRGDDEDEAGKLFD
jgi:VCBS repeat-containing protein